jgi:DNA-binding CsgD family transcriptional regulator
MEMPSPERVRIAQELHDGIAQDLVGIGYSLDALLSPQSFSATDIAGAIKRTRETFGLSQRELQILSQLHKGAPLKEFADSLFITESTLKTHLSAIYRKMGVKNRVQAIEKAKQSGLS